MRIRLSALALAIGCAVSPIFIRAQQPPPIESVIDALTFRNIGPFRTAAWVTAIDVPETPLHDHLYTMYAASRSGGLWKTTNAGTTWTNVTDSIGAEAMGAVAVAPSDSNIVWIGEGDQANARSSISGKGVFTAGKLAKIETRALAKGDCVCSNESVIYPPLSKVDNAHPAYTLNMTYDGKGLDRTWSTVNKRSAFLATFEL